MIALKKPIWIVLTVSFIIYLFLLLRLHFNYNTTDSDLAIYDQQIWFLSQGRLVVSSFKDFNQFGDHFGLIEVLIAPLYWLWDSVVVLLIIQTLAIILSAVPIYWTFKKHLKVTEAWALLFIIGYLLYFGFQAGTIFPFHLATLATVFIAWTIYGMLEEKWFLYWVMLILTLITKEDLPLFGLVLGVYLTFKKKYRVGLTTIFLSSIYFYIVTYKIIPFFFGKKYAYFVSQLGDSPVQIVINSLKNPIHAVTYFFTPLVKLRTMFSMFASFSFLTLLSPTFLFLLSPFLAERFLSETIQRHLPWMHYSTNQGPLLAYGAIFGLINLGRIVNKTKMLALFKKYLVQFSIVGLLLLTVGITLIYRMPLLNFFNPSFYLPSPGSAAIYQALKLVPPKANIATQSSLQPHLSHRDHILKYPDPSNSFDGRSEDLPEDAKPAEYAIPKGSEYILLSVNAFHWRPVTREDFAKQIAYVKSLPQWEIIYDQDGTTLFRKKL